MDLQSTPQPARGVPTSAEVADVVAATHLVKKRKRAGTHLVQPAPSPATAPTPASVPTPALTGKRVPRAVNYTEIEDTTLCRAWSQVGMDAAHDTDQTGKRYWQRIEDRFCQLMPRVKNPVNRTFRSLQGRWEVIKSACSRWSAAMDAVIQNPISGSTVDEYEGFAHDRYKQMKGSNGKRFAFKHCHDVLKHLPKWQLRDQEKEIKKGAMKMLDDSDEDGAPKWDKPEGTKKAKERLKMAAEQTTLNDKFDQMMKTKETVAMKTLETKLTIYEKKKEIKLAMIEAARVDATRKADLEEKKINIKREKAMKELLAEEKEIMMMNTSVMNETQLLWWNNTTAEITARRSLLHQSGTGGASVEHEQNPRLDFSLACW